MLNWLVGARVTATDQPESLENLRSNLYQNTRSHQQHKPQVAALTHDLEQIFPHSKCHYDYVLAAEALYNHDCFTELLVSMKHFCQPGTNLIWAIKVCYPSDLIFIDDFNKAFHTTMLAELDRVRIYLATHRAPHNEDDLMKTTSMEEEMEKCQSAWNNTEDENPTREKTRNSQDCSIDREENKGRCEEAVLRHQELKHEQELSVGTDSEGKESLVHGESESFSTGIKISANELRRFIMLHLCNVISPPFSDESDEELSCQRIWESKFYFPGKEIHYFMGQKIIIEESFDSYGAMTWPAVSVD